MAFIPKERKRPAANRRTTNDPKAKAEIIYGYNIYRKDYKRTFVQRISGEHGSVSHVFDLYKKEIPLDILERAISYAQQRGRSITFTKDNNMERAILVVRKQTDALAEFEAIAEYDLAVELVFHPSFAPRFVVLEGREHKNRFYSCFSADDNHDVRMSNDGECWYDIIGFVDNTYEAQLLLNVAYTHSSGVPMF